MDALEIKDEKILRVADLLEQIQDVNRMIELHREDEDSFMIDQYRYRRNKFVKELGEILEEFEINLNDLAA